MTNKKKTSTTITSKPKFTLKELDDALLMAEEYMERAMCPFVLLGQTLGTIMDKDQVDGDKIEIGVLAKYLTKEVMGLFKEWKFTEGNGKFTFWVGLVPVEIKVIHKTYPFFENQDLRFYKISNYKIPNPWKAYWDVRGLIR